MLGAMCPCSKSPKDQACCIDPLENQLLDLLEVVDVELTYDNIANHLRVTEEAIRKKLLPGLADKVGVARGRGVDRRLAAWSARNRRSGPEAPALATTVDDDAIRWLRDIYREQIEKAGGRLLNRGPHLYPAAFFDAQNQNLAELFPADAVTMQHIEDRLLLMDPRPRRRRRGLDEDHPPADAESKSTQGDNYCMKGFSKSDGKLKMSAWLGTYGQIMDSSDSMIDELRDLGRSGSGGRIGRDAMASLPLRHRISRLDDNPFTAANARAAGIGISALVCFRGMDSETIFGIAARRSRSVSTWQDVWHVFPSGMLGQRWGFAGGFQGQDVENAIIAEFVEELFGDEYVESGDVPREYVKRVFLNAVRESGAEVVLTGIAFDLLNLRPEICAAVIVPSRDWWGATQFRPNREIADGRLYFLEINDDDAGMATWTPTDCVPSGAAAFWAGTDAARITLQ
jgi:hypothetical protein